MKNFGIKSLHLSMDKTMSFTVITNCECPPTSTGSLVFRCVWPVLKGFKERGREKRDLKPQEELWTVRDRCEIKTDRDFESPLSDWLTTC